MSSLNSSTNLEAYRPELTRLARYLLRGYDQQLDEIVDDAMLAYLAHGHKGNGTTRTKLTRCLRNRVANEQERLATWRGLYRSLEGIPDEALLPTPYPKNDIVLDVNAAVDALPPPYSTIVRQYYLEGGTLHEVATSHGLPVSTTHRYLGEGVEQLSESLKAYRLRDG